MRKAEPSGCDMRGVYRSVIHRCILALLTIFVFPMNSGAISPDYLIENGDFASDLSYWSGDLVSDWDNGWGWISTETGYCPSPHGCAKVWLHSNPQANLTQEFKIAPKGYILIGYWERSDVEGDANIYAELVINGSTVLSVPYTSCPLGGCNISISDYAGNVSTLQFHATNPSATYAARFWVDNVEIYYPSASTPVIISYSNTVTNNESTTFSTTSGTSVTFNVTANQTINNFTWSKNGATQSNTSDNYNTTFILEPQYIQNATYINRGSEYSNYGGEPYILYDSTGGGANIIFNLLELPENGTNVLLNLFIDANTTSTIIYFGETCEFDESTVTWNNFCGAIYSYKNFSLVAGTWNSFILDNPPKYLAITGNSSSTTIWINSDDNIENKPYITTPQTTIKVYGSNEYSNTQTITWTVNVSSTVTISCPIGWCYLGSNYTSKTLLQFDNLFSTDTIQGRYNRTSKKYEDHRTGYKTNENVTVAQKEGYYYYFSSAQDITTTPGSTPSISLKTGWNLVANYGSSARTLSALKTSIGASATQAQWYNKTTKAWVSTDSQSVPAMEAFMVYVTSQTVWSD